METKSLKEFIAQIAMGTFGGAAVISVMTVVFLMLRLFLSHILSSPLDGLFGAEWFMAIVIWLIILLIYRSKKNLSWLWLLGSLIFGSALSLIVIMLLFIFALSIRR